MRTVRLRELGPPVALHVVGRGSNYADICTSLLSYGSVFFPEKLLLTGIHFDKYAVSLLTGSSVIGFERSQSIVQPNLELEFLLSSFKCWDLYVSHSERRLFKQSCFANIIESTYTN